MLSIGILGEYLGRLHFRSMHQPNYLVRIERGGTWSPVGRRPTPSPAPFPSGPPPPERRTLDGMQGTRRATLTL